jgi:hypothetical protein
MFRLSCQIVLAAAFSAALTSARASEGEPVLDQSMPYSDQHQR